jgi:hypothetical protein
MSRTNKIKWTTTEQADFYAAFVAEMKERKLQFPVKAMDLRPLLESARVAMKVLKVERRRDITSIDSIRGEVAQRLIDNGFFPRKYLEELRKKRIKAEDKPDPRDELIKHLETTLAERDADLAALRDNLAGAESRIAQLEQQPSPVDLIKSFFSDIIAEGLEKRERAGKPAHMIIPPTRKDEGPLPAFERERRKDPVAVAQGAPGAAGKPKFALVGDFVGSDKARIHEELSPLAELRYIDAQTKFQGLKQFNANHGRIVVWEDHSPHDWVRMLANMGVTFRRHAGSLPSLIESVRKSASAH